MALSDSRPDRRLAAPSRPLPSSRTGLPRLRGPLSRRAVPTYPGGPVQVHLSAASPDRAAFPVIWPGRRPQLPFRGLLRLHTRYRPSIRSPAPGEVGRRASTRPVAQPHRLPATGPTDHCPGGTCTHKETAPFGAHQMTQMDKWDGRRSGSSLRFVIAGLDPAMTILHQYESELGYPQMIGKMSSVKMPSLTYPSVSSVDNFSSCPSPQSANSTCPAHAISTNTTT